MTTTTTNGGITSRGMSVITLLMLALGALIAILGLAGCSTGNKQAGSQATGAISVISREDGSGTRGAFTELLGIVDANGNDATTATAVVTNSTATVLTTVAGDPAAIGYVSLGSLNDSVKALQIDGVTPSIGTVKDGSYVVARPFNVVTTPGLSAPAKDFLAFVLSEDGQGIVEENGYVAVADDAQAYAPSGNVSGKVTVAGSSSVTPVMEKLAEAYQEANPDVEVEVQQSDSSTGVQGAIDGICDIGMASRALKDSETSQGVTETTIAMDGIAVIVNRDAAVSGLTSDQVRSIYLGEVTDWGEVA